MKARPASMLVKVSINIDNLLNILSVTSEVAFK